MAINVFDINDPDGNVIAADWLARAESVHRQIRPQLPENYPERMGHVFAAGGRMSVAANGNSVVGVAVYRIYENTALGIHMYVDDLVTDETRRSKGVGRALLEHLSIIAKRRDCKKLTLDSAIHRQQAHKFYFREGFVITSFHFHKQL